ncbi:MAG: glycosyltransferase family 39 protein, partial [Candidatus Diapherotrites archaeon]|nr:glycosyltransferase family 39 protein [Candidatus Diapherotrites archaeon]
MNFDKRTILLFVILFSGFMLRFYEPVEQGLLYWDEGKYLNEAKLWLGEKNLTIELEQLSSGEKILPSPTSLKPIFVWFISIAMLFFGMTSQAGFFVSALFGFATIVLLYFFCKKFFNKNVALFASAFLAFDPLQIFLSRRVLSETTSLFFVLLCIYFYLSYRHDKKLSNFFLTGIFLGMAFGSKESGLLLLPLILGFEIYYFLKKNFRLMNLAVFLSGFAVSIFAIFLVFAFFGFNYVSVLLARIYMLGFGKFFITHTFLSGFERYLIVSPESLSGFVQGIFQTFSYYFSFVSIYPALLFFVFAWIVLVLFKKVKVEKFLLVFCMAWIVSLIVYS